jgi:hypothetical protein
MFFHAVHDNQPNHRLIMKLSWALVAKLIYFGRIETGFDAPRQRAIMFVNSYQTARFVRLVIYGSPQAGGGIMRKRHRSQREGKKQYRN